MSINEITKKLTTINTTMDNTDINTNTDIHTTMDINTDIATDINPRIIIATPAKSSGGVDGTVMAAVSSSAELMNKSPLRYPGGKTRACKVLDDIIQEHFDMSNSTIISPFFGGGSFEFYLQNKYNSPIVANDIFQPLYTFWNQCKVDNTSLCSLLMQNVGCINKGIFAQYHATVMEESDTLQQSVSYFIINRCSFSGSTLSGGFSLEAAQKRFTPSSVNRIGALNLDHFEIHNLDFEEFINNHGTTGKLKTPFIFLDPPYYLEKKSNLYGKNGKLHEDFDHERLHGSISKRRNWLMTYNNCEFIKNLYHDFTIIETTWSYGMNKTKESSEIIIFNGG